MRIRFGCGLDSRIYGIYCQYTTIYHYSDKTYTIRSHYAVMWPDCTYYITVLLYCCVLTVYNTLYKFVTTQRDGFCQIRQVCLSVCPSACNNSALTGRIFTKFDIWGFFKKKICRDNSRFIKIGQEKRVLYMKSNVHFWSYLAQWFLEWEMFQTNVAEKIKTHNISSVTSPPTPPPRNLCSLWDSFISIQP